MEGSVWKWLLLNHTKPAEVLLDLRSCTTEEAGVGKAGHLKACTTCTETKRYPRVNTEMSYIDIVPKWLNKCACVDQDTVHIGTTKLQTCSIYPGKTEQLKMKTTKKSIIRSVINKLQVSVVYDRGFSRRMFCFTRWVTKAFWRTIVTRNWNCSSFLCRHTCHRAWYAKTIALRYFRTLQKWGSVWTYSARQQFFSRLVRFSLSLKICTLYVSLKRMLGTTSVKHVC